MAIKKINQNILANKKERIFWNDPKNITWFNQQPFSSYWVDFFKTIKNKSEKKVLDIGCGGGRNVEMLLRMNFDVYACDKYLGMINSTKDRLKLLGQSKEFIDNRVKQCIMEKLLYSDNYFDFVLCHGIYHNASSISDLKTAVEESSRVLKTGGFLCLNIFTIEYIDQNLTKLSGKAEFCTSDGLRMILLSSKEILKILERQHLIVVKKYLVNYVSRVNTGNRSVLRGIFKKI
jgi:ubiquinone/menaquinone biosynthesis C-methylase UbiE